MEYSLTFMNAREQVRALVLILILMEYSLTFPLKYKETGEIVLILILMEYSLTKTYLLTFNLSKCLNPYSNGILPDVRQTGRASDVLLS